jgi:hypothetical protein
MGAFFIFFIDERTWKLAKDSGGPNISPLAFCGPVCFCFARKLFVLSTSSPLRAMYSWLWEYPNGGAPCTRLMYHGLSVGMASSNPENVA